MYNLNYRNILFIIYLFILTNCINTENYLSIEKINPTNQDSWVNSPLKTKKYLEENNIKATKKDFNNSDSDIKDIKWVKSFNDKQLEYFVKKALDRNYDLKIAYYNLKESAALARKAGADLFPFVDIGAGTLNTGNFDTGKSRDPLIAFANVSWEVDLWGRINSTKKAAKEVFEATKSDFFYAQQSIIAQTIKSYLIAIETKRQLNLAKNNLKSYNDTLDVTSSFFSEGLVSIQDVHLAKSEKALSENDLEQAKIKHLEALRSLELLVVEYPSGTTKVPKELPKIPASPPLGIPSEILERRPDIIAAERRIASSLNLFSSAQAARLPRLSLRASINGADNSLSEIFDPENIIWNLTSNLLFPLFDSGKLKEDVNISKSRVEKAVALYRQSALNAFKSVENSLYKEKILRKRLKSLSEAYYNAKEAENIAFEKYKNGDGDIFDVQQLQRNTIVSHVSLLDIQNSILIERVNLYLELGGGFEDIIKESDSELKARNHKEDNFDNKAFTSK